MRHKYIYTPNSTSFKHLGKVKEEMKTLGAPTIRVIDTGESYIAIEGSHRLQAAKDLGLMPDLKIIEMDSLISNHDFDDLPSECQACQLAEYVMDSLQSISFFGD